MPITQSGYRYESRYDAPGGPFDRRDPEQRSSDDFFERNARIVDGYKEADGRFRTNQPSPKPPRKSTKKPK